MQYQAAVTLTPDNHPDKPSRLSNLGTAFSTRSRHLKNPADLNNAIAQQQAAVDLTPDGHPDKPGRLINLAKSFLTRFGRLRQSIDAEVAISHFSAAAMSPTGPPTVRFNAAKAWMGSATLIKHKSLMPACECALGVLPLVAWLGLPIQDRHQHLVKIGGTVRDAAAVAISLGEYDKALEMARGGTIDSMDSDSSASNPCRSINGRSTQTLLIGFCKFLAYYIKDSNEMGFQMEICNL